MTNITELEAKYQELGKEIEKLKAKDSEYPKFFKDRTYGFIVKFTSLEHGTLMTKYDTNKVGKSYPWTAHVYTNIWEEVPRDKTTGFYHKQLVWCWDTIWTHLKQLRFYDARSSCSFYWDGTGDSSEFDNYEPYDWSCDFINEWAVEAVQTLKDK